MRFSPGPTTRPQIPAEPKAESSRAPVRLLKNPNTLCRLVTLNIAIARFDHFLMRELAAERRRFGYRRFGCALRETFMGRFELSVDAQLIAAENPSNLE